METIGLWAVTVLVGVGVFDIALGLLDTFIGGRKDA